VGEFDARSFDAPSRALARLAAVQPAIAFRMASALGALRNRLTQRWPSPAEVHELFPGADARMLAMEIGALNERNRVLVRCLLRRGLDPIRPLVTSSLDVIDQPCILALFHTGALHAIGAALERMQRPVLAFRIGRIFTPRPPLTILSTKGTPESRAGALHQALLHLRHGGIVAMALDDAPDQTIEARCFGRPLAIAPGAFALARWSAVPIVPVTACWRSSRIQIDMHDAIESASEAAAWLENYLRESPSELTLGLLRKLLGVS
jgi:hypothetical protein